MAENIQSLLSQFLSGSVSSNNDKAVQAEKEYQTLCMDTATMVVASIGPDNLCATFEKMIEVLSKRLPRNVSRTMYNSLKRIKEHSLQETVELVFSNLEKNTYINPKELADLKKIYNTQLALLNTGTYLFPDQKISKDVQEKLQKTTILFIKDETGNLNKKISKMGYSSSGDGFAKKILLQQNVIKAFAQTPQDITQDELGKILVNFLFIQTLDRFPLNEVAKYQKALTEYASKYYSFTANQTISSERLMATYQDLLQSFNESMDISDNDEVVVHTTYTDFHQNAQGHFSTTCTIFTALSMLHELGLYQQIKTKYNLQTYQDVDQFAYKVLKKYNENIPEQNVLTDESAITQHNIDRRDAPGKFYGLLMYVLAQMLDDFAEQLGAAHYQFISKFIHNRYEDNDEVTGKQVLLSLLENFDSLPGGIIVGIKSSAGPHVVHITQYDAEKKTITYYDSLGKDGNLNIYELPLVQFSDCLLIPLEYIIAEKKEN